jgi:hypothetical protein
MWTMGSGSNRKRQKVGLEFSSRSSDWGRPVRDGGIYWRDAQLQGKVPPDVSDDQNRSMAIPGEVGSENSV